MSVFVCSNCSCFENSNLVKGNKESEKIFSPVYKVSSLVSPHHDELSENFKQIKDILDTEKIFKDKASISKHVTDTFNNTVKPERPMKDITELDSYFKESEIVIYEYPMLSLMDMVGHGSRKGKEINMLCSQCNTGTWHGEFKRELVRTIDPEYKVMLLSEFNMVTQYDHPKFSLIKDDNEDSHGYIVNPVFEKMLDQVVEGLCEITHDTSDDIFLVQMLNVVAKDKGISELTILDKIIMHPLYQIWLEDDVNFNPGCLLHINLAKDTIYDLELSILDSQRDPSRSKSEQYIHIATKHGVDVNNTKKLSRKLMGAGPMAAMVGGAVAMTGYNPHGKQPINNKPVQSNTEKEAKLRKASLKREIKSLKKEMNSPNYNKPFETCVKQDDLNKLESLQVEYKNIIV